MFIIAENLPIPIPGWEQPARSLPLVGLMMLIVTAVIVGWDDVAQTPADTKPKVDAGMLNGRS